MITAAVDIGTNSTRLLIAEVQGGRVSAEIERRSTVTRLGAGVDANGHLNPEAIERTCATLAEYKALIDRHDARRAVAVMTSAVRDAADGARFAAQVGRDYGLTPHILTGDQEARLTFAGATSERDPGERTPTAVIDVGGGSTEIVIGEGHEPRFHVSTQAGVVRQTERHLHEDPPTADELHELEHDVRATLAAAVPDKERERVEQAIAVAGTATSLAAIAQGLDPYDPDKVHGYHVDRRQAGQILARLATVPLAERRQTRGLHPDRAPTIIAGVVILLAALELFGLQGFEASEHDILRGAALQLAA